MLLTKFEPFNYTGHEIVLHTSSGSIVKFEKRGACWACPIPERTAFIRKIDGDYEVHSAGFPGDSNSDIIVSHKPQYTGVSWQPSQPPYGSDLIVSILAAEQIKQEPYRVFTPDMSKSSVMRDQNGKIIGIRRLQLRSDFFAATHRLRVVRDEKNYSCRAYSRHTIDSEGLSEARNELNGEIESELMTDLVLEIIDGAGIRLFSIPFLADDADIMKGISPFTQKEAENSSVALDMDRNR